MFCQKPGVRTPGFWQNMNNGGLYWDGKDDNEKNAGDDCFPDGELLYDIAGKPLGLLVGDWNGDGVEDADGADDILGTDDDEDTLYISYDAARILINASQKEQQDGRYMLGRDLVATWLNYLAGNDIGDIDAADGHDSPIEAIQGAINFLQTYGDTSDDGILATANKKSIVWEGSSVPTNKPAWQTWGADLHGDLDEYNNTGWIDGQQYAHDCDDSAFTTALSIYNSQVASLL
jgi:hypothetical protein